jgi:Uma2 family endonuclease
MTPEEYLAFERASEERHEYIDGEIFAMSGASYAHVRLVSNLSRQLGNSLQGGPCVPLTNDMRVRAGATRFCYPDVVVLCGPPELEDNDILLNPTLIVEVLSETTEAYDRGAKFSYYRGLGSLSKYLLVSQTEIRIEQFVRQADGRWLLSEATGGALALPSLGVALAIDAVYDGVPLAPPPNRAE